MKTGQYIVWFAHYGSIDHKHHPGPLEEIVDWVAGMDDEDIHQYDQHGIPLDVEEIGTGIVWDFHDMVDARREQRDEERKALAAQYAAERERRRSERVGPRYVIRLQPPAEVGKGLARCGPVIAAGLTHDQCITERDRLEAIFGQERITAQER